MIFDYIRFGKIKYIWEINRLYDYKTFQCKQQILDFYTSHELPVLKNSILLVRIILLATGKVAIEHKVCLFE